MKVIIPFFFAFFAFGCNSSKKSTKAENEHIAEQQYNLKLSDSLLQKFNSGSDFYATGNQPSSWVLDMDYDKNFSFTSTDGIQVSTYAVKGKETPGATLYEPVTKAGKMLIQIFNETCSGNKNKKVTVTIAGKNYTGCGQFLFNNQLNDTWILRKAGSETLEEKMFAKGLPRLQFDLKDHRVSGHDGCNSLSGTISVEGTRIKFGPLMQTKMYCENNNQMVEKIIAEKISLQAANYYFRNGKLFLYLVDDNLLEFSKAEK